MIRRHKKETLVRNLSRRERALIRSESKRLEDMHRLKMIKDYFRRSAEARKRLYERHKKKV